MNKRHPSKEIQAAIEFALGHDWRVEKRKGKGHCWARLYCPHNDRTGCKISIWSTPRSAFNHARQIVRMVEKCKCDS